MYIHPTITLKSCFQNFKSVQVCLTLFVQRDENPGFRYINIDEINPLSSISSIFFIPKCKNFLSKCKKMGSGCRVKGKEHKRRNRRKGHKRHKGRKWRKGHRGHIGLFRMPDADRR